MFGKDDLNDEERFKWASEGEEKADLLQLFHYKDGTVSLSR